MILTLFELFHTTFKSALASYTTYQYLNQLVVTHAFSVAFSSTDEEAALQFSCRAKLGYFLLDELSFSDLKALDFL